jgi:hypothetical protein
MVLPTHAARGGVRIGSGTRNAFSAVADGGRNRLVSPVVCTSGADGRSNEQRRRGRDDGPARDAKTRTHSSRHPRRIRTSAYVRSFDDLRH